ncbi:MAG: hypothetical protein M9894_15500 [Planctomycetes bacterium]|nr:hypothetical protein [Planctomycetota bacterium]
MTLRPPALLLALLLAPALAQDPPPRLAPRADVQAPPRVPLHPDAQTGDTLERTSEQRDVVVRERTTIVARLDDGRLVVERTSSAAGAVALRLVVDATGRTLTAWGGAPGDRALAPVPIAEEPPPPPERLVGHEERAVAGVTYRCERRVIEQESPVRLTTVRLVVADGPRAGLVVLQESQVAGRSTRFELVGLTETTLEVGDRAVPCLRADRRPLLDGVPSPVVSEWIALEPLPFGETLVRLDNGLGITHLTALGRDGRTVFPDVPIPD